MAQAEKSKALFTYTSASGSVVNWIIVWTTDGKSWTTAAFDHIEDARAFAHDLCDKYERRRSFMLYAQRSCVVYTPDFLNDDKHPLDVTIQDRVTLPTGYYGEGRR